MAADAPRAFRTPAAFRAWLAGNHATSTELIVRCYKNHAASKGMTYHQALDEALCFGWIDGVRRSCDADTFTQRFTPRRPKSIWSRVNLAKVKVLIRAGRMAAPGLATYRARDKARTGLYSFEREAVRLSPAFEKRFRAAKDAWTFFEAQPPGYRRLLAFWVMNPKGNAARERRFARLLESSRKEKRVT